MRLFSSAIQSREVSESLLSGGNQGQASGGNFSSQYQQRPQPQTREVPQQAAPSQTMAGPGPESFEDDSIPF